MSTPNDNIHNQFGALVAQLARQWRRAVNRRLQPLGLTEATWLPLLHLARARTPMRQKDLAAAIGLDSSSVVRLLDELESAGLLERREGSDRRAKELHITRQGQTTVEQVEVLAAELREQMLAEIAESDLATTFRVLSHLSGLLAEDTAA